MQLPFLYHLSLTDRSRALNIPDLPTLKLELGINMNPEDIEEGDDVYFECKVNANPSAYKVVWKHNVSIRCGILVLVPVFSTFSSRSLHRSAVAFHSLIYLFFGGRTIGWIKDVCLPLHPLLCVHLDRVVCYWVGGVARITQTAVPKMRKRKAAVQLLVRFEIEIAPCSCRPALGLELVCSELCTLVVSDHMLALQLLARARIASSSYICIEPQLQDKAKTLQKRKRIERKVMEGDKHKKREKKKKDPPLKQNVKTMHQDRFR